MKSWGIWVVLLVVMLMVVACASIPAKQRAVLVLSTVESALESAHDFEMANYGVLGENVPASADLKKLCPLPALPAPLPADATVHQVVGCLFAQAFQSQITSANAIRSYKAGDTVPSLGRLRGQVDALFGVVKGLTQNTNQQKMLALAQATVDTVLDTIKSLGIPVPAVVPGGAN